MTTTNEQNDPNEPTERRASIAAIQQAISHLVRLVELPAVGEVIARDTGVTLGGPYSRALTRVVRDSPITTSEISRALALDVSTLSRQLSALERQGLVRRERKDDDRRAYLLHPTDEGERIFAALLDRWVDAIDEFLADWPSERVDAFATEFSDFVRHLRVFAERAVAQSSPVRRL